MTNRVRIIVSSLLLLIASAAQAITVSFDPAAQTTTVGSSVNVNLGISGLGSGTAPSLGTFDLNINYDPSVLSFTSVNFGDLILGDQLNLSGLGSITSSSNATPGVVNLFELSFDNPADLNTLQAGDFTLASLTFAAISSGTSSLNIAINSLGDADGNPLTANVTAGSVTGIAAVPLPATVWLFGSGIIVLFRLKRRGNR